MLLVNFSPEIDENEVSHWKDKAKGIIEKYVRPSVMSYLEQLQVDHLPKGRTDENPGIMWIDGGEEVYLRSLRK